MPIRSARSLRILRLSVPLSLGLHCLAPITAAASALSQPAPVHSVEGAYLSGIVAGSLGDAQTASSDLLAVVGADPADAAVRSQAFVYATMAGRKEAITLAPQAAGNPLAPLVLGNDAARSGQWQEAQLYYSRIGGSPLDGLLRPLLTAWAQQGAGHTDLAMSILLPLTQSSPISGVYALHAAMIADLAERGAEAGRLYQLALANYPGSDLVFVQSYASYLARSGRPQEAQALLHALVHALPSIAIAEPGMDAALDQSPINTASDGLARAFLTLASLIQQQGAPGREAEGFMVRFALGMEPGLTPARLLLADLRNDAGEPQEALAILNAVPRNDPLAPVADLRAGVIAGAVPADRAKGRAILKRLVRTYPKRAEPLQALADLLQDDGQYAQSIAAYDRALALMSPLDGTDWPVLFARATAYDRNQQWNKAQSDLERALQLAPNEPFLLNYLGYSWLERNQDLAPARAMIERALSAKPEDGSIRDSLGWAMFRQNDVAGAVRELERAAEQMPEDATVNYHLGAAYWAAGRKVEARDQWRWALNLHPDPDDAARIRAALRVSQKPGADPLLAADGLSLPHP